MEIFALSWVAFLLTGFGTLFLIGEVLVNMRGIFGILGIGFIVIYFSAYLEPGTIILMLIIYFVGLLLIIIDGKFVKDRKSTRLNSSHVAISYAVFCLKHNT